MTSACPPIAPGPISSESETRGQSPLAPEGYNRAGANALSVASRRLETWPTSAGWNTLLLTATTECAHLRDCRKAFGRAPQIEGDPDTKNPGACWSPRRGGYQAMHLGENTIIPSGSSASPTMEGLLGRD